MVLSLIAVFSPNMLGLIAVVGISLSLSLMFPTIYGVALQGLGPDTKFGAAGLVMAILGGALMPPIMGLIMDHAGTTAGFIVPAVCLAFVAAYALFDLAVRSARRSAGRRGRRALTGSPRGPGYRRHPSRREEQADVRGGRGGARRPGRATGRAGRWSRTRAAVRPTSRSGWPGSANPVTLMTRLGRDAFGEMVSGHLKASGVRVDGGPTPARKTSLAVASLAAGVATYDFRIEWDIGDLAPLPGRDPLPAHRLAGDRPGARCGPR